MRTDDLERIILKLFVDNEYHGYEIRKKLELENIKVDSGRLYRVMNGMLSKGLLESRWDKSKFGPKKKICWLSPNGKEQLEKTLLEAIETVHGFYTEYLLNLPAQICAFGKISESLTNHLKAQANVAYVISRFSPIQKKLISTLHSKIPEGKIYLVKPNSTEADIKLNNLLLLKGTISNIPLKENHVDLLVITELPSEDSLATAMREWCRVLKSNGTLAILTPTILIQGQEDPLDIGDFIEKYEHEILEKNEHSKCSLVEVSLRNYFQKLETRNIIHMTVLLASRPYPYAEAELTVFESS